MKRPKNPSARTVRRADARAIDKLGDAREKLWLLESGGTPDHPLEVVSPAQVEGKATAHRCPRCEGTLRVDEHAAERIDGRPLRVAHLRCVQCGTARRMYFRVVTREAN